MAVLFPRSSSPELEPFVRPFGAMMLAFGRAHEAVVEFARLELPDEGEARRYVSGTEELPRRMRRLFRDKIDRARFARLDAALKRFTEVANERHHLIHGEWWFDPFDGGQLVVRRLHRGELTHAFHATPARIAAWTATLDGVADELETIWDGISMEREGILNATD